MTITSATYALEVENRADLDNAVQELARVHPNLSATRINYNQKSQWNQALNNYEYLPTFVASITFTTLRVGAQPTGSIAAMDAAIVDDYLD